MEGKKRIDKEYWLGVGYDLVEGSYQRLLKRISDIGTYINALLSFYVVGSVIDVIYLEITDFTQYIWIVAPVLLIKGVEWYAKVFSVPDPIEFYPGSPDSIEIAHDTYVSDAEKHLKRMKVLAFLATALILGVFTWTTWTSIVIKQDAEEEKKTTKKLKEEKQVLTDSIAKYEVAHLELMNKKRREINAQYVASDNEVVMQGVFPANEYVTVLIQDLEKNIPLFNENRMVGNDGKLILAAKLTKKPLNGVKIFVEYKVSEVEKRVIERMINL